MVTSVFPRWKNDATPPFVYALAVRLVAEGCKVMVLAPHAVGSARQEMMGGVEVHRFRYFLPERYQKLCYEGGMLINFRRRPWTKLLLPFFFVAQRRAIDRIVGEWRPTILHSHSLLPQGLTVAAAARRFRLPHVTTSHGNDVFGLRPDGLMGRWKRSVLRQVEAVTVNSEATRKAVLELGADPARVHRIPAMPNSPEIKAELRGRLDTLWNTAGPRLLFVGRHIREKGIEILLEAVARLVPEYPTLRLCLVGEGPERASFENLSSRLELESVCRFVGGVPGEDISTWMNSAEILVVPSQRGAGGWVEAQGLVVVEAMAVGTPVVASRLGGIVDMISDGQTGYLCEPGDRAALAKRLKEALLDPGRKAVCEAARHRYLTDFSAEAVSAKTRACYNSVRGSPENSL
jgi:glycosyltransferase involved in cell wall biosynthesis